MSATGATLGGSIGTIVGGPIGTAVGTVIGATVGIIFDIIGLSEQSRLDNLEAELRTREVDFQQKQQSRQIEGQNIATVALRRIDYASSGFSQQNLLAIAQYNQYTVEVQDLKDQVRLRSDAIALGQEVKSINAAVKFATQVAGRINNIVGAVDKYQRSSSEPIQKKPSSIDPRTLNNPRYRVSSAKEGFYANVAFNNPRARLGTGYKAVIGLPDKLLGIRTQ